MVGRTWHLECINKQLSLQRQAGVGDAGGFREPRKVLWQSAVRAEDRRLRKKNYTCGVSSVGMDKQQSGPCFFGGFQCRVSNFIKITLRRYQIGTGAATWRCKALDLFFLKLILKGLLGKYLCWGICGKKGDGRLTPVKFETPLFCSSSKWLGET